MSPIKGLTDRGMAFAEIGQIRKGAKKTSETKPGTDLTYFRVEFDERETEAITAFISAYPREPQEINILLPFNEIERCWDANLEAYVASRLVARSDGVTYQYRIDHKTGKVLVKNGLNVETGVPLPYTEGEAVASYTNKNGKEVPVVCRPVGRLKVMIPELRRLAYLTLNTTSQHDIINISSQLEAIRQINNGQLVGVPVVMKRRPKMISTPNADGSRARRQKWLISLEVDPDWVKAKLTELKQLALPGNGLALLPDGHAHDEPLELELRESTDAADGFADDFEEEWYPGEAEDVEEVNPIEVNGKPSAWPIDLLTQLEESQVAPGGIDEVLARLERSRIMASVTEYEKLHRWLTVFQQHIDSGKTDEAAAVVTDKAYLKAAKTNEETNT